MKKTITKTVKEQELFHYNLCQVLSEFENNYIEKMIIGMYSVKEINDECEKFHNRINQEVMKFLDEIDREFTRNIVYHIYRSKYIRGDPIQNLRKKLNKESNQKEKLKKKMKISKDNIHILSKEEIKDDLYKNELDNRCEICDISPENNDSEFWFKEKEWQDLFDIYICQNCIEEIRKSMREKLIERRKKEEENK